MSNRFRTTFAACLLFLLGGAPRLSAQFDLFVAQIADGAGFFSEISVHNPGPSDTSCTFSTFDDGGNPLALIYDSGTASPASLRTRHHAVKAAATSPVSSVNFTVPAEGTTTLDTSGLGDGGTTALIGGAELNCASFVIGGVTYWLTSGSEMVTGIGVPAINTTTAFRVVGGNEFTAFAFYNPGNALALRLDAYDGDTGALVDSVIISIPPGGHIAFNARDQLTNLPSGFYGSFRVPTNGQQFVPLALGVASTNANEAGFLLYTIASLSGEIVGID